MYYLIYKNVGGFEKYLRVVGVILAVCCRFDAFIFQGQRAFLFDREGFSVKSIYLEVLSVASCEAI